MKKSTTERGFVLIEFTDSYGAKCTLQQSSSVTPKIWLGAKEIGLKEFKAGEGWEDVELEDTVEHNFIANNRMHLTQEQVKELLPLLENFAETGKI